MRTARLQEDLLKLFDWKMNELKALQGLHELTSDLLDKVDHTGNPFPVANAAMRLRDIGNGLPRQVDEVVFEYGGRPKGDNARLVARVAPFVRGQFVIGVAALVEDSLAQAIRIVLHAFPGKIRSDSRKVNLSGAIGLKSILDQAIESEVYSIFMGNHDALRRHISKIFSGEIFCDEHWQGYVELRARRDVGLHNGWRPNRTYREKSHSTLDPESEKLLYPTPDYTNNCFVLAETLLKALREHSMAKFSAHNRIETFKTMWQRSSLSKVVPFEEAWDYKPPTDVSSGGIWGKDNFEWKWSHSETLLWQFFSHVFYGQNKTSLPDIEYSRQRLNRNDVRMIDEWLESPFHL
jgi:hypothetical protein